jgi:hypothetical protein
MGVAENVDDWAREVAAAASTFSFVQTVLTIDKNPAALKMRLFLGPEFFVQVYVNVVTGTRNFALVLGRQRLYARDCVGGVWHRHPYRDSDAHDFSAEGARPVTVVKFLIEVQELVEEAGLL